MPDMHVVAALDVRGPCSSMAAVQPKQPPSSNDLTSITGSQPKRHRFAARQPFENVRLLQRLSALLHQAGTHWDLVGGLRWLLVRGRARREADSRVELVSGRLCQSILVQCTDGLACLCLPDGLWQEQLAPRMHIIFRWIMGICR